MSKDKNKNKDFTDSADARRAAKHADKKHGRHGRNDFKHNIKDALMSGDFEKFEDLKKDERHNRR